MTKKELIKKLQQKHQGLSLKECEKVADVFFASLKEQVRDKRRLEIRGFGSFFTKERLAKEALNPKTLEKVAIKNKTLIKFKPSKNLLAKLND